MGEMEQESTEKPVIAFLGPKASYTHQATISKFSPSTHIITPLTTIEDVFSAVQTGSARHGIVPFENSSNGSVVFTLDLFADTSNRYADIVVVGEIYLPVRHCLVGRVNPTAEGSKSAALPRHRLEDDVADGLVSGQVTPTQSQPLPPSARTKPLHDLTHVKKLYSHPQAWGQCKVFLNTYLKSTERQDVSSTSKAAEIIAAASDVNNAASAAISSRLAADLNNLTVLAEGIEDSEGNSTRFFILQNRHHSSAIPSSNSNNEHDFKTLISFSVPPHASAGALANSLAVFKKFDLNLTSINTRPSGLGAWHYVFFIEVVGRKRAEGEVGAVNAALEELGAVVSRWRWLGSWEAAEVGQK